MTPQYKFTFYHSSLPGGSLVVNQPVGWREAVISLERDEKYHSLIEYFKGNFMWWGKALKTIQEIEDLDGPDAIIGVTIEIMYKRYVWEDLFTGMLKPAQLEEISRGWKIYKMLCPIIRDDFWARFINRADNPVNLGGSLDVDGNVRTAIPKIVLPTPSQKIRLSSHYVEPVGTAILGAASFDTGDYVQIGFTESIIDEARANMNLLTDRNTSLPVGVWVPENDGEYAFDIVISMSAYFKNQRISEGEGFCDVPTSGYDSVSGSFKCFLQVNDDAPIEFSYDDSPLIVVKRGTKFFLNVSGINLVKGDQVRVYARSYNDDWDDNLVPDSTNFPSLIIWGKDNSQILTNTFTSSLYDGDFCFPSDAGFMLVNHGGLPEDLEVSYMKIVGDTIYTDTETDAYLIKDAAESIASKIIGQDNVIASSLLDGCAGRNAIMRGKHMRGHTFASLEFSASWNDYWNGLEPLYNCGLSYDKIAGVKKIRIEDKAYFYNPNPIVNIGNLADVTRKYDMERFFKSVEVGFEKWSAESDSGIDDPQTKRTFNSNLSNFGSDLKIMSKWIAASLAIERSRRNRVELGKDDRLDEDILLVALDGVVNTPELGTAYIVTNLLNADSRYNIRHTAVRIYGRWKNYINGTFQHSVGTEYAFAKGEGNYKTTSEIIDPTDCEYTGEPVVENADQIVTSGSLFVPRIYEIKFPLKWDVYGVIRNNRERALGLSRTNENFVPCHIMNLDFVLNKPQAKALVIQATNAKL